MSQQEDGPVKIIDARGTYCPGPLMELIRNIKESEVNDTFEIWSSDTGSQRDIPKWAEKAGHQLVAIYHEEGYDRIRVRKTR